MVLTADTECKLHIPHVGDKIQGDHQTYGKGWRPKSFFKRKHYYNSVSQYDDMMGVKYYEQNMCTFLARLLGAKGVKSLSFCLAQSALTGAQ